MEPKIINGWDELEKCKSESHVLIIDNCSGWIAENDADKEAWNQHHYLSTHSFYEETHKESTELLQRCGFNVVLANWDEGRT